MHRLLDIVKPDNLYLGQKDFQQCMVITKLIDLIGMKGNTAVTICPTLRESDGLAMSSRNVRLDPIQRKKAPAIFRALDGIKSKLKEKSPFQLKQEAIAQLTKDGFKVDYIEIADATTLQPVDASNGKQKLVALAAAFLGDIRLIDNLILS
jgi:pantoate--beta-alanine ligase